MAWNWMLLSSYFDSDANNQFRFLMHHVLYVSIHNVSMNNAAYINMYMYICIYTVMILGRALHPSPFDGGGSTLSGEEDGL